MKIEIEISTMRSLKTWEIHQREIAPMAHPINGPRIAIRNASHIISPADETTPSASAIFLSTKNRTTALPSLSSDSPSIVVDRETLAPSSRNIATTATGSVADVIVPKRRQ